MASNPGDIVLDVFGGSGSSYHAAQLHKRQWIGCEIADVIPIIARINTFFGLDEVENITPELHKFFNQEFIDSQVQFYMAENRMAHYKAVKLEKVTKSMHLSKSRVF
jgi:hypothetical protein